MTGRPSGVTPVTRDLPAIRRIQGPGYEIIVSPGLLDLVGPLAEAAVPAHRWAVVTDAHVEAALGARVRAGFARPGTTWHVFPAGERHKTRETWAALTDDLLAAGHGRDSALLALGGGVAGDLGGFVAATYLRGIPVVQVPTSLLAMVDAAVGGKTGVDVPAGKNLVGAFHPPAQVLVDPQALATLPLAERRAALAEVLKHGVVADAAYFARIVEALPALVSPDGHAAPAMIEAIVRSIEIKAAIVREDERETGRRRVLNFGHTIGHGLEAAAAYAVPHGEAVAIGMALEARLAERLGVAEAGTAATVDDALARAGLPSRWPGGVSLEVALAAMRLDKKGRGGRIACALPARIGAAAAESDGWRVDVAEADVRSVILSA